MPVPFLGTFEKMGDWFVHADCTETYFVAIRPNAELAIVFTPSTLGDDGEAVTHLGQTFPSIRHLYNTLSTRPGASQELALLRAQQCKVAVYGKLFAELKVLQEAAGRHHIPKNRIRFLLATEDNPTEGTGRNPKDTLQAVLEGVDLPGENTVGEALAKVFKRDCWPHPSLADYIQWLQQLGSFPEEFPAL